jgi:hypothetical protein
MTLARTIVGGILAASLISACTTNPQPKPRVLVRFSTCAGVLKAIRTPATPERPAQYPIEHPAPPRGGIAAGGVPDTAPVPLVRDASEPSDMKTVNDEIVRVHGVYGDADHGEFVVLRTAEVWVTHRSGPLRGRTQIVALPGFARAGQRFDEENRRLAVEVNGVLTDSSRAFVFVGGENEPYEGRRSMPTTIYIYDVTAKPRLSSRIRLDGTTVSAKLVGGTIQLVLSSSGKALPRYEAETVGEAPASGSIVRCDRVWRERRVTGGELLSLLSIRPERMRPEHHVSVLANPVGVHASTGSLLVATNAPTDDTWVHRFGVPGYLGSARVPGRLLAGWDATLSNRWSLSEEGADVRIVTRDPVSPDGGSRIPATIETIVSVLRAQGRSLRLIGRAVRRSDPGTVAGIRLLGSVGVIETRSFPPARTVRLIDLDRPALAGVLPALAYQTQYLALRDGLILTKVGARAPYAYTLFDLLDPDQPRAIETLRTRTRFWSHAIALLHARVTPLEGMPDDI